MTPGAVKLGSNQFLKEFTGVVRDNRAVGKHGAELAENGTTIMSVVVSVKDSSSSWDLHLLQEDDVNVFTFVLEGKSFCWSGRPIAEVTSLPKAEAITNGNMIFSPLTMFALVVKIVPELEVGFHVKRLERECGIAVTMRRIRRRRTTAASAVAAAAMRRPAGTPVTTRTPVTAITMMSRA